MAHPASWEKSKIDLSPLHIIPGLINVSVKATDKESEIFAYQAKIPQNKCVQEEKNRYLLVRKLHNYLKTKSLVQN